nr:MAG TPA: Proprotein convertase subtilisin/kexin type 9, LDL RECEPTOR, AUTOCATALYTIC CLEAVAGE [Caudoviricetes sp.]
MVRRGDFSRSKGNGLRWVEDLRILWPWWPLPLTVLYDR